MFRDVMGAKEVRVRIMEGVRRGRGGDCGVQLRWDWGADFENVWPFAVCVLPPPMVKESGTRTLT